MNTEPARRGPLRPALVLAVVAAFAAAAHGQHPERELVATITGPLLQGGIVSELAWDGGVLIIQTAAMEPTGVLKPRYLTVAGPGMEVVSLADPPAAVARYWKMKASRVSPTGLGRITTEHDSKMPMYGVASLERRILDAHDTGGTRQTQTLMLRDLVLHSRTSEVPPYDGEVWGWSPPDLNRIAYVDDKGDLWIARADGKDPERILRGAFTLPAWSEDGRTLAVAERKDNGRKWEISVIHLPEKHRQ